ncbi:MAG: S9 family peptidase [Bacteroidetes bacterium]|nr:MAG: S9 family peptidase [Bacteroidota bacterium]
MKKFITILSALFISAFVLAQEKAKQDDYKRAVSFLGDNLYNKKVFNLNIKINWFADSSGFWYSLQSSTQKQYLKISFPNLIKTNLFDHQKLAKILTDSLVENIRHDSIPISKLDYKSAESIIINIKNKNYVFNSVNNSISRFKQPDKDNPNQKPSYNKKWTAYAENYNLYIKSGNNEKRQLSTSGEKQYEYASWYDWADIMYGENGDRPEQFFTEWSENDKWIYTKICDLRSAHKMYLLDWSIDSLYRPRLLSYYRGSPGDIAMVYEEPVFFNISTGKEIKPKLPRSTHINAVDVEWSKFDGIVYLVWYRRGYKEFKLYRFDLKNEHLETIYEEKSTTNIDNFVYKLAEKKGIMFFLSEKSGWRQLYRLDLKTKKVVSITRGEFYIDKIERIDESNEQIYFTALGKEKGRNPYHKHLYKVKFNGKSLKLLTKEDRNHEIVFSPNGKYFIDNFSTAKYKTKTVLRLAATGEILKKIGEADISGLDNWETPEIFTAIAQDGKTKLYGSLCKPSNFNPNKKYPIIDHSYTGPHYSIFPNSFNRVFYDQSLAELGFIVMRVDGLGTAKRSKSFHNYSYKNLGGGLVDHIGVIRQLAQKYNWIDTTRVGIFGHSAGGYDAAHGLLAFPDFYKVAVASSADHDHRMEKAWWPEMYMGWPVDSAYHKQSNITMAKNLKGKLLISHGGIDENVNPSATFKLAEALINADKQFDILILPSQRHGYQGIHRKYFIKTRWNYFVEHLLGVEPIWDFEWE